MDVVCDVVDVSVTLDDEVAVADTGTVDCDVFVVVNDVGEDDVV